MAALLIIGLFFLTLYHVYHKITKVYSYWEKKRVKGPKPNLIFGNITEIIWNQKYNMTTLGAKIYNEFPNEKVVGIYQGLIPTLIVRDPNIMKTVLIKDFSYFVNRGIGLGKEPIRRNIVVADENEWKILRQKLTPIFTISKLKGMMPIIHSCVDQYMEYCNNLVDGITPCEIRSLKQKFTMKTIAAVAFGMDVNIYTEEKTEFQIFAEKLIPIGLKRRFSIFVSIFCPRLKVLLPVGFNPEVAKFFKNTVKEIVRNRERKPKATKDFVDFINELKEDQETISREKDGGKTELQITDDIIAAQAIAFYVAGFETSSGAMSFLLYELALNAKIQARCHEEIDKVMKKYNVKLDYDALKEFSYLSMVLAETLRKYPIAGMLFREAVTGYTFKELNLTIDKGTKIWMPVISIQMDPQYFPDPENFEPERFLPGNRDNLQDYYMPFGEGPRNCIGLSFAQIEILLVIAHFLHKFKVSPCDQTPMKIMFDPQKTVLTNARGIWLNIERRRRDNHSTNQA